MGEGYKGDRDLDDSVITEQPVQYLDIKFQFFWGHTTARETRKVWALEEKPVHPVSQRTF